MGARGQRSADPVSLIEPPDGGSSLELGAGDQRVAEAIVAARAARHLERAALYDVVEVAASGSSTTTSGTPA